MKQRKMNLAAFVVAGPVSGHHGGWRYPTADRNLLSLEYYRNIGRILEDGRFDLIFFADILAIPNRYEGKLDSQLRYGALGSLRLDPLLVLSTMAASTKYLGLASTISTSYFHPFAVARAMATLDHLSGGRAMIRAAGSARSGDLLLLGVTLLTSANEQTLREIGIPDKIDNHVLRLAKLGVSAGIGGLVASPREAKMLRAEFGKEIKIVTPGVRPSWAEAVDQNRVMTPRQALEAGADYLVIGRPITAHPNPLEAVVKILAEIEA